MEHDALLARRLPLLLIVFFIACGDDPAPYLGIDAGVGMDAHLGGGGPSDGQPEDVYEPRIEARVPTSGSGTISVHQDGDGYVAAAAFWGPARDLGRCSGLVLSPCAMATCSSPLMPEGRGPSPQAGVIHVTGGTIPIELTPNDWGDYADAIGTVSLFLGGETVVIDAMDGDLPRFSFRTTAPTPITLDAPILSPTAAPMAISRSSDLHFSWRGESDGLVVIRLSTTTRDETHVHAQEIACTYGVATQAATLPFEVLEYLRVGATGELSVTTRNLENRLVLDRLWQLSLNVSVSSTNARGAPARARIVVR